MLARALPVGVGALLCPRLVKAAVVLDPNDPANFKQGGTHPVTPGSVLRFDDESVSDYAVVFCQRADAGCQEEFSDRALRSRGGYNDAGRACSRLESVMMGNRLCS